MKIQVWSQEEASKEISKRLDRCMKHRLQFEGDWKTNEETLYSRDLTDTGVITDDVTGLALETGEGPGMSEVNLNYAMKYIRFIHAQMSANPPSAIPTPTSEDLKDRRSANVANSLIQHGQREHHAQEIFDRISLDSQVYGTGVLRSWFNPAKGVIVDANEETGEVELTGDNEFKRINILDFWYDSGADCWEEVRYIFIRHRMPIEQAIYMFPSREEQIQATKVKARGGFFNDDPEADDDMVDLYEYIEKGLPWNGGVGRYGWLLDKGLMLSPIAENPFSNASIPVNLLTDIDVPGQVYGRAVTSYLARAQEILSAIDSTELDNIQAHAVIRMVLPDGATIEDEGISNNGWEYVKTSGNAGTAPFFMSPPSLMPDIHKFRDQILQGMADITGVNESMTGKQSREMSGFSMQTAINAGNMTRRRLFNKYTALVRWAWETYLSDVRENWTDKRKILVTGEEGSLDVAYFSGADIQGGFDLQVDYGQSFSLDPASRREEIMQLAPMLEKAGMTSKEILDKIKLNDVKGLYDINSLARRRQEEIFESMIAKAEKGTPTYIEPRELQEHKGMLDAAYKFVMTKRFDNQPEEVKLLIEKHIRAREELATEAAAAPAEGAAPPGMPMAPPAAPPMM